jgi:hypothetical protein
MSTTDPDFIAGMAEVNDFLAGSPSRFDRLEAQIPRPCLSPFSLNLPHEDPEPNRWLVLRSLVIRKSITPRVKEVLCNGTLVGRVANVGPLRWIASTRRGECFTSQTDAALALWLDNQAEVQP